LSELLFCTRENARLMVDFQNYDMKLSTTLSKYRFQYVQEPNGFWLYEAMLELTTGAGKLWRLFCMWQRQWEKTISKTKKRMDEIGKKLIKMLCHELKSSSSNFMAYIDWNFAPRAFLLRMKLNVAKLFLHPSKMSTNIVGIWLGNIFPTMVAGF